MLDLNNYLDLATGEPHNLWQAPPFAATPPVLSLSATITEQPTLAHQRFSAQVTTDCPNCLLVFKQTYHPNWQAFLDGQPVRPLMVFPAFMAIKIPGGPLAGEASSHQIIFEYQPTFLKIPLVFLGIATLIGLFFLKVK